MIIARNDWIPDLSAETRPWHTLPAMLAIRLGLIWLFLVWLTGFAGPFLLVALLVAASFVLAAFNSSPRPAATLLDARAMVALWVRELVAAFATLFIFMPLEAFLMRRDTTGGRAELPRVLLIHGYANNAGAMFILWRAIKSAGYGVHTINLEPIYADIDSYADSIEARLAAISANHAGQRIILVCHSMGGLAARAYLRKFGAARVSAALTLGTPHAGTVHAATALGRNASQMRPGSAWLAELARFEGGLWPCPLVSFFSHDDNIVAPQMSACLAGASNVALAGVGHISLAMSAGVAAQVVGKIDDVAGAAAG